MEKRLVLAVGNINSFIFNGTIKGAMVLKDNILKMQSQRTAKQIKGFNEEYFIDMNQAEEYLNKN